MAVPVIKFDAPDPGLYNVDDDLDKIREDIQALYAAVALASVGIPVAIGATEVITPTTPSKPTVVEWTGLPNGRKVKLTISYTGTNPTSVIIAMDNGAGYETLATQTLTYNGSDEWTGSST